MSKLLRFSGAVRRDPEIEGWFSVVDPLRAFVRPCFERMRGCGPDVRELLHDGCPVICVGDAPFAYVNAFTAHASVGFYQGAELPDPAGLLEGAGKRMRHVKLRFGADANDAALARLIVAAYADIRRRLAATSAMSEPAGARMKKKSVTAAKAAKSGAAEGESGGNDSRLIDARIAALGDWRGAVLARVRKLILEADPAVTEEWKWRGVPVWSHAGIICTGETYKDKVKLTFAKGASLADPSGLFNASLDGNARRAIDIRDGEKIDARALKALIRAAVAKNTGRA